MFHEKIKTLQELKETIDQQRDANSTIVHCHGVFDLIHVGHIRHFEEAKKTGTILVVTVTPDRFVFKGPNRPVFSTDLRLEAIAALEAVDFVAANLWPDAVETIQFLRPDIYCKGPDYLKHEEDLSGMIGPEQEAVEKVGGRILYTSGEIFSSSNLLNKYGFSLDPLQASYISELRSRTSKEQVDELFHLLSDLRVVVLGESIVDQYVFCEALGKSGKEPILVSRKLFEENYAGGAFAIARHLANFCGEVTLLTMLGEDGLHENFFRSLSPKNMNLQFVYKKDSPTIVKQRFIDRVSGNKTFGVYSLEESFLSPTQELELISALDEKVGSHDLMVISDYGHGFISPEVARAISKITLFKTVNAQVNAGNVGYHTLRNYSDIDCVVVNEGELRHELRNRSSPIKELAGRLRAELNIEYLAVTQGSQGVTLFDQTSVSGCSCPAFAADLVDKVGSGDAMLALLSCCLFRKVDRHLSLLAASLAAAQIVGLMGNKEPVGKQQLKTTLRHILK